MKIGVLIPAHNEASAISTVVSQCVSLGYGVVVVDDGSKDATAALAKEAGAFVLSTGKKSGKGTALRLGFDELLRQGYEAIITVDGDGQHDPNDLKNFVQACASYDAAIVNGNRMSNPQGMPCLRLLTNRGMSGIISLICGQRIPDTQCGFRLIKSDVLRAVKLSSADFEIETEMLIKASRKNFKIVSTPITTIYRDEVSKIDPVKDTLRFVRFIFRMMVDKNDD